MLLLAKSFYKLCNICLHHSIISVHGIHGRFLIKPCSPRFACRTDSKLCEIIQYVQNKPSDVFTLPTQWSYYRFQTTTHFPTFYSNIWMNHRLLLMFFLPLFHRNSIVWQLKNGFSCDVLSFKYYISENGFFWKNLIKFNLFGTVITTRSEQQMWKTIF